MKSIPQPYYLQTGDNAGLPIDWLVINNFKGQAGQLKLLNKLNGQKNKKNSYHQYLTWIISRARTMQPTRLCPHCQAQAISKIALKNRGNYFEVDDNKLAFCCNDSDCQRQARYHSRGGELRKVSFELFYARPRKTKCTIPRNLSEDFVKLILRYCYEMPPEINEKWAVNFFRQPTVS